MKKASNGKNPCELMPRLLGGKMPLGKRLSLGWYPQRLPKGSLYFPFFYPQLIQQRLHLIQFELKNPSLQI